MDGKAFDALVRGAGSRRAVVRGLGAGLLAAVGGRAAAEARQAPVGVEGCRIERCKKAVLGQDCADRNGRPDNHQCCQGLKCKARSRNRATCVFKNGHGGAGDWCDNDRDCNAGFFCKKNQCIPNSCGA